MRATRRDRIGRVERQRRLVHLNRLLRSHERGWTREVKTTFSKITKRTSAAVAGSGRAMLPELEQTARDLLVSVLTRRLLTTALTFGDTVTSEPKFATRLLERKDFRDTFEAAVRQWIAGYALSKARTIARSYFSQVEDVIREGFEEGLGSVAVGRRIRTVVGVQYSQWQAERIARTEAHTSANMGMERAVDSTGLRVDREWMSAEDSRTRQSHNAADGQIVGQEEPFIVGGSSLMFPGDPSAPAKEIINCRCVLAYHPR